MMSSTVAVMLPVLAFGATVAGQVATPPAGAQAPATQDVGRPVVLQKVLVKVNGAIFTKTELEQLQIDALREQNQRQLSQMDLENDASLRAALVQITPQILAQSIDELIMTQRGRDLGLRMSDEQFNSMVKSIKDQYQLDQAGFEQELKTQGITMEQLRKNFEKTYLIQGVQRTEIQPRISITEEEARQYYRAHPEEFMKPTMVTVREISVLVPTETQLGQRVVNVAADEAAKAKIDEARERALKGEDFAALVTEYSESGSKANGGLIGPLNLAELAESLQAVLKPLKTGDIAEPIRTPVGFQLLKVESKTEAAVEPFESVRAEVTNMVQQSRAEVEMTKYLESLREQAIIEWKDQDLKKLYEQFMQQQKKVS